MELKRAYKADVKMVIEWRVKYRQQTPSGSLITTFYHC